MSPKPDVATEDLRDFLLAALRRSLQRKLPDVAEHIVAALEALDQEPSAGGPRVMAYRIIARHG